MDILLIVIWGIPIIIYVVLIIILLIKIQTCCLTNRKADLGQNKRWRHESEDLFGESGFGFEIKYSGKTFDKPNLSYNFNALEDTKATMFLPPAKSDYKQLFKQESRPMETGISEYVIRNDKVFINVVQMENYENYIKSSLEKQNLQQEYKNILTYGSRNYSAVDRNISFEYVDMKYITIPQIPKAYVAINLLSNDEISQFWKIIWDENVRCLIFFEDVSTCDTKEKIKFSPEKQKTLLGDNLIIESISTKECQYYDLKTLTLKYKEKTRQISQFHFSLSFDIGLSVRRCLQFFQIMSNIPLSSEFPIAINSSSGMTGVTFVLLCDMCLRTAKEEGAVDVMGNFYRLIQCTPEMKVDFDHFVLIHEMLLENVYHINTSISCSDFDANKLELFDEVQIEEQVQYLIKTLWLDRLHTTIGLKRIYYGFSSSDHLKSPKQLIVAKQASPFLFANFLTTLKEERISVVVTLNENILSWPMEPDQIININQEIILKHKATKSFQTFTWITLELWHTSECQIIEILSFKNWLAPSNSFPDLFNFVNFVTEFDQVFQNYESVLVTCHDGVFASGLFVAMSKVVQQVKAEGKCDVYSCVRDSRRFCDSFVNDKVQYCYLLKAAHIYLKDATLYES